MGLEDFERELAQNKAKSSRSKREDHHSHRDDRHPHKRSRHDRETSEERARRKRRERDRDRDRHHHRERRERRERSTDRSQRKHKERRARTPSGDASDTPLDKDYAPPEEDTLDHLLEEASEAQLQRDSWMQAPSSLDVDYVQRKKKEEKTQFVGASAQKQHALKVHDAELNRHLHDIEREENETPVEDEPVQRDVPYTFGDSGSHWRMTKLKGVYRIAEEEGRPVGDVALEKYGNLRDFDDAREEEIEVDRRRMYGKDYVGKEKPSGELYAERRLEAGIHRPSRKPSHQMDELPQGKIVPDAQSEVPKMSVTELNKLKAQLLKAKMKRAPNVAELEAQYNAAMARGVDGSASNLVVLNAMDNRMLAGGRQGEVNELINKRGLERGLVVENEDMSIEDMVRQERRTKNQNEGMLLAEKIGKDAKFDNDLDYLDENATKLATRAPKSTLNLRNTAISEYHRTNRILDSCPLCHHEDKSPPQPPVAPILSLATRVFLTLPTEPEISSGGAVIVPIQHRTNLLECDDDEWEEIRNFMKCLTRMYHDQGRDVIFYENAARPGQKRHAAMNAVPIPFELGETAPAFFREAILSSDAEWSQHKPIIDTLKAAKTTHGKAAFRKSLAKEMPYFHVWFELDGGMGHIVEDERAWPRSDLFARETLGGMLDVDIEVVKRQGRWVKGDRRVDGWKKRWRKFDWTRALTDA